MSLGEPFGMEFSSTQAMTIRRVKEVFWEIQPTWIQI